MVPNIFTKPQTSKYDTDSKTHQSLTTFLAGNKSLPLALSLQSINHETLAGTGNCCDWYSFLTTKYIEGATTLKQDFKLMDPPTNNGLLLSTVLTTLNNGIYAHVHDGPSLFKYLLQYIICVNKMNNSFCRWGRDERREYQRAWVDNVVSGLDPITAMKDINDQLKLTGKGNVVPKDLQKIKQRWIANAKKGGNTNNSNYQGNNNNKKGYQKRGPNNNGNFQGGSKGNKFKGYQSEPTITPERNPPRYVSQPPVSFNGNNGYEPPQIPNHQPTIDTYQQTGANIYQQLTDAQLNDKFSQFLDKKLRYHNNRKKN